MNKYAVLCHPGHNRVYFKQSLAFAAAELEIVSTSLKSPLQRVALETIAGLPYVVFEAGDPLGEEDLRQLARLSFLYGLFSLKESLLLPMALPRIHHLDPSLGSMLKYTGKTNELFTRLLINLALAASDYSHCPQITLLDPMAGKGTTLLEGASLGFDVCGIEIGEKVVTEVYHFFKKYLESQRLKHTVKESKISGPNRSFTARKYTFRYGETREAIKAGDERCFEILAGRGEYASHMLGKGIAHILVADLPYGVQHGNVTREGGAFTRNPKELLCDCLPGWREVLKKGGAMALSWNTHVLPRCEMAALLEAQGMAVQQTVPHLAFSHRVDQAIQRDLVVAVKQ